MWTRLALAAYWLVLFASTHYPRVYVPDQIPKSDKLIHFTAFAGLAILFWFALAVRRPLTNASIGIAALVLIPYATLDEYTQQLFGRHTDFADWMANVAGIACALGVLELRRRRAARASSS